MRLGISAAKSLEYLRHETLAAHRRTQRQANRRNRAGVLHTCYGSLRCCRGVVLFAQVTMFPADLQEKMYLGDGVYVGHDDYHVWLYTDNGIAITNKIALEPEVLAAFERWRQCLKSV
jgi:hypothetical protein